MTGGALETQPRLRPDLRIVRREVDGRVQFVVKEPGEGRFAQFGEAEMTLLGLMDGSRTPAAIATEAGAALGARIEAGAVADFAQKLKRMGFVERTPAENHLMLMERLRSHRRVRARGRARGSILRIRFSIGDPDRLFDRWVGRLRWLWTPGFAAICVGLFAFYIVVLVLRHEEMLAGARSFYTQRGLSFTDYVLAYLIFVVVGGIHELGHGLTTKRYGGEVHEIGGMLLYFMPALFCNTNDAWLFERRSQRLWVTFAGPWIQVTVASLAAIVWLFLEPGTAFYRLTFLVILVGGVSGVLGNLNPLIPLDGYYALSDWLEIPNLRGRAFGYWNWLGRRWVLGVDAPEPAVTPRERRVFLIYGGLALVYSAMAMVVGLLWLTMILNRLIGPWVWPLVAVIAGRILWRRRGRFRTLAELAARTGRARLVRSRSLAAAGTAGVLLLVLPFLLPWTPRARGHLRVEAAPRARVTAPVPGVLERIAVDDGDTVVPGEPVARLWNPSLRADLAALETRAEELRLAQPGTASGTGRDDAARSAAVLREVEEELAVLERRHRGLLVRAPIGGIVLGYRLAERSGEALAEGDLLFEIGSAEGRQARVRVAAADAGAVAVGQRVRFKLDAWPSRTLESRIASVAPAAEAGWVEALAPLPRGEILPRPGMAGTAKIVTRRGTVADAIGRAIHRVFRLELGL